MDFVRQFAEEAAPFFDQHRWKWDRVHATAGIPTVDEVEQFATRLLAEAEVDGEMSSGRIRATVEPNGERRLSLIFGMKKEILVTAHE